MPNYAPDEVRTIEEAIREGYTPMDLPYAQTLQPCLELMERIRYKRAWLRLLRPNEIAFLKGYLDPSLLRCSFIIVTRQGRYGIWRRDITRDN